MALPAARFVLQDAAPAEQARALDDFLQDSLGQPVDIDCADLRIMGARIVEIIVSARATWTKSGHRLALGGLSERHLSDLSILGIELVQVTGGDR